MMEMTTESWNSKNLPTERPTRQPNSDYYAVCGYSEYSTRGNSGRIVGGTEAAAGQWPWQVALFCQRNCTRCEPSFFCGCSLIARNWVLSAAHCFGCSWSDIRVYTGIIDKSRSSLRQFDPALVYALDGHDALIRHESFNSDLDNDIALLRLSRDVMLNSIIRPICMPNAVVKEKALYSPRGKPPFVAGWGHTRPYDLGNLCYLYGSIPTSSLLRHVGVPVRTHKECRNSFKNHYRCKGVASYKPKMAFCAGELEGGLDSCKGDSGGPVMRRKTFADGSKRWVQIGIVSWGEGCAVEGRYGIYTRLSAYTDWIEGHIGRPCAPLSAPAHGSLIGSNFNVKQSVSFRCQTGYVVNGSSSRTCRGDGTWSGTQPLCQIMTCDTPPPISNGRILFDSGSNFSYTNSIGYECNDFYEIRGVSFRECQANATWSFQSPSCEPICGESSFAPREYGWQPRIVGGREAAEGSWPWQTLVTVYASSHGFVNTESFCGGSLLNEEWVLTAARCVTGWDENRPRFFGKLVPTDALEVYLGVHNRRQHTQETLYTSVQEVIKHPDFDPSTLDSDVALLHLNRSVQFTDYIRPICLPEQNRQPGRDDGSTVQIQNVSDIEDTGVVIGWGRTGEQRPTSTRLREVHVGVYVPRDVCNETMEYGYVTRNMVCAGPREGGKDKCSGDAGGPLMLRHATTGRYFQYGMVSWGEGCGGEGKYGVYGRIENFVNWIQSVIEIER